MNEYHQKTVNMSKPRTGQVIMDAMQAIAQKSDLTYRTQVNRGEPRTLKVGFSSSYPYKHVAILTGDRLDRTELQPEATYERVAVGSESWDGIVYAIGYGQKSVEDAVNKIAADLEARL